MIPAEVKPRASVTDSVVSATSNPSDGWIRWLAVLAIAIGFALRLNNLAVQSLWFDEAGSLAQANQSIGAIIFEIEPAHLPVYFLALKLWSALAGQSELSARFFSVAGSLVAVPFAFWVGGLLGGRVFRVAALAIFAIQPALIYYGQEVRMYAFLPAFGLLALGSFVDAERRPDGPGRTRRWVLHGVAIAACCYLHYYGAVIELTSLALFAICLASVWRSQVERARLIRGWLTSQAIFALLFGPWVAYRAGDAAAVQSAFAGDFSYPAYLWRSGVGLLLGHHLEQQTLVITDGLANETYWYALRLLVPMLVLLAIGLVPDRSRSWKVLVTAAAVPLAAVLLLTLSGRDFGSRYLLVAGPALWLILARGIALSAGFSRPAGLIAAALFFVPAVYAYLSLADPALAKEDNRSLAAYLERSVAPDDLILLNASYNSFALNYYYDGPARSTPMPSTYPPVTARTDAELTEAAGNYRRFWLMLWQDYYSDPAGTVKGWLDSHAFQFDTQVFHGLTLYGYLANSPILKSLPPMTALSGKFGAVSLHGYTVEPLPSSQENGSAEYRLRLYWSASERIDKSYRVYAQIVNPVYHVYGQKDNRPVFDRYPTTRWLPGTYIEDEYPLRVDPGTPPGEYQIAVGLYDEATGARLKLEGGDRDYALVGPIKISESRVEPDPTHRLDVRVGDSVRLRGFDLQGEARAGETLQLTLHWQATGPVPPGVTVFNHLVDATGKLVAQKDSQPADGTYPTASWSPGVYVRDKYDLILPATLPPGVYRLQSGMYLPGGERLPASPGQTNRSVLIAELTVR